MPGELCKGDCDCSAICRNAEPLMSMYKSFVGRTTVPTATRMCLGKVYSCMTDLMSSATFMTNCSHVSIMRSGILEV